MFAEPRETVLLFPGQTRYEQKGGGTITSTERRIRFSPEIRGPRIGETRSEWEIIRDLAMHVLPAEKRPHLNFPDGDAIRAEIDRIIPMYGGIADMKHERDSFQYGGARTLNEGICENLPDKRARFSATVPQNPVLEEGQYYLTTRRGKQFNSIVYGTEDALTGSRRRDEIWLAPEDANKIGLCEGEKIRLRSEHGTFEGVYKPADLNPHTVMVYWPEGNVLIPRTIDPLSQEPDYNTIVRIERID